MLELPRVMLPMRRSHSLGNQSTVTARRQTLTATVLVGSSVAAYAVAFHHTPLNCWRPSREHLRPLSGISSQRAGYHETSLSNYLSRRRDAIWPDHFFAPLRARSFSQSGADTRNEKHRHGRLHGRNGQDNR